MKRILKILMVPVIIGTIFFALASQGVKNYMAPGGEAWTIGGTLTVASAGTLNVANGGYLKIAGVTVSATAAQLNYLNGITPGTVTASKALVVDASKNLTIGGNWSATNYYAGASGTAGTVRVYPATASNGYIIIQAADNGGARNLTIQNAALAASRVVTVPDPGADANFVMNAGNQTIAGAKTFSSTILTSSGVGAAATGVTVVENGDGVIHQTVLTVTFSGANGITLADGDHGGGKKMYDFPEGYIQVIGVVANGVLTNTANFNAHAADTFSYGIGTATAADDNSLAGTEQDVIAVQTIDTTSGTVLTRAAKNTLATVTAWDGTTTAVDFYLNLACADANNSGSNDFTWIGTVTITWVNLGDY